MIETRTMIVLEELTWNSTKKKEHFVQREIQSHLVTFRSVANKSIHLKSHLSSVFSIPPRREAPQQENVRSLYEKGQGPLTPRQNQIENTVSACCLLCWTQGVILYNTRCAGMDPFLWNICRHPDMNCFQRSPWTSPSFLHTREMSQCFTKICTIRVTSMRT